MVTEDSRCLLALLAPLLCVLACACAGCGSTSGAGGGGGPPDAGASSDASAPGDVGSADAAAGVDALVVQDTARADPDGATRMDSASDAVVAPDADMTDALPPCGDLATGDAHPDAVDVAAADLGSPDAGPDPPERYVVHAHLPDWEQAFMHFSVAGGEWTEPPGVPMVPEQPPWFHRAEAPGGVDLQLVFSDGADGWFPGGIGNDLRTSWPEIWVQEGLVFTHPPASPRPDDELVVLTLNLHTYQEADARAKLGRVAEVIARLRPDFVCLQECAQHSSAALIEDPRAVPGEAVDAIRADNMAHLIAGDLAERFGIETRYTFSWAHYGWDVWQEGLAVMTPHPVVGTEQRFISQLTTRNNINSRKAVLLAAEVPGHGRIHAFSTHTSWGPTQAEQLRRLSAWVIEEEEAVGPLATVVAGDFNADAGGDGYGLLVDPLVGGLRDSYAEANPRGFSDPTFPGDASRIDYIFSRRAGPLRAKTSQIYFRYVPTLGGRVSDHYGVVTRFRVVR